KLYFHRVPDFWRKDEKLSFLAQSINTSRTDNVLKSVKWQELKPDERNTWLVPANADQFKSYLPVATKEAKSSKSLNAQAIFRLFSLGVATNRDNVVYDFLAAPLSQRVKEFIDDYNGEVDRHKRIKGQASVDEFVKYDKIKW